MAATNYNDINSPIFTRQKKDDAGPKKYITGVEDSPESTKEKPEPEYRIKSLSVIIPPEGIKQNSVPTLYYEDYDENWVQNGELCCEGRTREIISLSLNLQPSHQLNCHFYPSTLGIFLSH